MVSSSAVDPVRQPGPAMRHWSKRPPTAIPARPPAWPGWLNVIPKLQTCCSYSLLRVQHRTEATDWGGTPRLLLYSGFRTPLAFHLASEFDTACRVASSCKLARAMESSDSNPPI